jgi:hypothetical protein
MSFVKNTAEFLRNLGLSSNSKPRESGNELSGGYSPKNVAKELFLTPENGRFERLALRRQSICPS